MRLRLFAVPALAGVLALTAGTLPAWAAFTFTVSATATSLHPGDSTTVSGDTADPACTSDGVAVTLTYTKPDGSNGFVTQNVVSDSSGHFTTTPMTLPDDAVAGEDASVHAVIADCTADPSSPTKASDPLAIEVVAYTGTFSVDKTSGKPGQTVHLAGTNCWGGDVLVLLSDGTHEDEAPVTLTAQKTFSGSYVLPDLPGGTYSFAAQCPGTDFAPVAFTLVNPKKVVTPPPAPAPKPIVRPVHFTG